MVNKKNKKNQPKKQKTKKQYPSLIIPVTVIVISLAIFGSFELINDVVAYFSVGHNKQAENIDTNTIIFSSTLTSQIIEANYTYNLSVETFNNETERQIWYYLSFVNTSIINKVTYSNQTDCKGLISRFSHDVYISQCDNESFRNVYLNSTNWLPFVLYHEIAHAVLNTSNQCKADTYAFEMMEKINVSVQKTNDNCIEEYLKIDIVGYNGTISAGYEDDGTVTVILEE